MKHGTSRRRRLFRDSDGRPDREMVKVQRGWKSFGSEIAEGQRIQYNFVKPHMALDGQTPAQVAGVGVNGKNTHVRRMELLKNSITTNGRTE